MKRSFYGSDLVHIDAQLEKVLDHKEGSDRMKANVHECSTATAHRRSSDRLSGRKWLYEDCRRRRDLFPSVPIRVPDDDERVRASWVPR